MTKQKKITAAVALIAVIAVIIVSIFLMSGNTGGAANVQEIAIEKLEPLSKEEGSALSGVCDHTISLGETDDLESLIEKDDTIVEKIEIDADNVDFEKAGEYEATYQITFDMEALNDWLDENERSVSFQTDTDPVIVKTTATITVQEETAKTSDGSKDTEGTDKKQTASDDKDSEGSSSSNSSSNSSSDTSGSSSGGSSSQSNHQHRWVSRTETVEVPETITVDHKEQKYTLYRFYWYNTGSWEESRDPARFHKWSRSDSGQMYPLRHPYDRPEDHPLFTGYDGNGNPMYTNDHSIITDYETVPCEPYEKTVMVEVTRTVQICSVCGARK